MRWRATLNFVGVLVLEQIGSHPGSVTGADCTSQRGINRRNSLRFAQNLIEISRNTYSPLSVVIPTTYIAWDTHARGFMGDWPSSCAE
ncbi:hypothetical protein SBV1_2860007 [Verrucomicrobia bacterium]|nr:hypothetical protein SBV1_2860007 [Verrucomicrobiota bacterium]